jgi:hypothetical protein
VSRPTDVQQEGDDGEERSEYISAHELRAKVKLNTDELNPECQFLFAEIDKQVKEITCYRTTKQRNLSVTNGMIVSHDEVEIEKRRVAIIPFMKYVPLSALSTMLDISVGDLKRMRPVDVLRPVIAIMSQRSPGNVTGMVNSYKRLIRWLIYKKSPGKGKSCTALELYNFLEEIEGQDHEFKSVRHTTLSAFKILVKDFGFDLPVDTRIITQRIKTKRTPKSKTVPSIAIILALERAATDTTASVFVKGIAAAFLKLALSCVRVVQSQRSGAAVNLTVDGKESGFVQYTTDKEKHPDFTKQASKFYWTPLEGISG